MTEQTPDQNAADAAEAAHAAEVAAELAASEAARAAEGWHWDARQEGTLSDPRDLGPVGGSHVE